MLKLCAVTLAATASMATLAVAACAPVDTAITYDKPVDVLEGCAFVNASENDVDGFFTGAEAIARNNGYVTQSVTSAQSLCGETQALLVLDCTRKDFFVLGGKSYPANLSETERPAPLIGPSIVLTANILKPLGPFDLNDLPTPSGISKLAKDYEITIHTDADAFFIGDRPRNRFDMFCGCKVHFPDSLGAQE